MQLCVIWLVLPTTVSPTPSSSSSRSVRLKRVVVLSCAQELLPPGCAEPPNLDLGLLMDVPGTQGSKSRLPPLRAKSPDVELATLVTAIQATNSKVREVDHMVEDANTNIVHLQVQCQVSRVCGKHATFMGRCLAAQDTYTHTRTHHVWCELMLPSSQPPLHAVAQRTDLEDEP